MTQELIELRKLAEAATQGKRHHWVNKRDGGTHVQLSAGDNDLCCRIEIASTTQADIEFIAAANPAAVISLLDQIQALQAENERLKAKEVEVHNIMRKSWLNLEAERDALAAKLDDQLDELRAVMCGVGVVGKIAGADVICRESVIDLIDRRRNAAKGGQQ